MEDPNWEYTKKLTKPFWLAYEQVMKVNVFEQSQAQCFIEQVVDDDSSRVSESLYDDGFDDEEEIDSEYLKFIKITREHQKERDRQKKLNQRKGCSSQQTKRQKVEDDYFYSDMSQLNTLTQDNLAVPYKSDINAGLLTQVGEQRVKFIELYGSLENYDKVRCLEMSIDHFFSQKCKELKPEFWPAVPINLKPFLNKTEND